MKMRTLFMANVIVQLLFGLGFLLFPPLVLSLFGAQTDAAGTTLTRVAGGLLLSLAIIGWLGKDVEPGPTREALVYGFTFAHFQAGILTTVGILNATFNSLAWFVVLLEAFFVVSFLWLRARP